MNFGKALEALKVGACIKLPHWSGYWRREGDTVKMYCKDGTVLDIRETQDVFYTLGNIASDEWEVVGTCDIDYVHTFGFGEAIRRMKAGQKVARKGWNGKRMYIFLAGVTSWGHNTVLHEELTAAYDCIAMRTANAVLCFGWLASQIDMLAEDWFVVESEDEDHEKEEPVSDK